MKIEDAGRIFSDMKALQEEINSNLDTKAIIGQTNYNDVFDHRLTKNTRGYIEKVAAQVNGSYRNGYYDSYSVMIRRLIETLIIEAFESHKAGADVKNASGDYLYLRDLINAAINSSHWSLGRNTRQALNDLKEIGDKSAHSRRFNAQKKDIDDIKGALRDAVQELTYIAKLK